MRIISVVVALALISASSAKDMKQDNNLRGEVEKPAENSEFMKEVTDEDVKFWTRELAGHTSGRK
eukprot:CAMPEP_0197432646 /NCGR_PEP_ID=MMETSP1175-20131217/684_1 /TAXON_ID=1003142 /ORGANISM="Triceratium dubium, Strain CCMP147" /LENGTH=64 /DNA_ID=CAMNT_0042960793 /DNA_START=21 /DNA_END=215 /DNA_ORIENTATION=-